MIQLPSSFGKLSKKTNQSPLPSFLTGKGSKEYFLPQAVCWNSGHDLLLSRNIVNSKGSEEARGDSLHSTCLED